MNSRLRGEIRGFTNALLVQGGHAPIEDAPALPPKMIQPKRSWPQIARRREAEVARAMRQMENVTTKEGEHAS